MGANRPGAGITRIRPEASPKIWTIGAAGCRYCSPLGLFAPTVAPDSGRPSPRSGRRGPPNGVVTTPCGQSVGIRGHRT
eukprot:3217287-Pyramimonas_sp.AAC.1